MLERKIMEEKYVGQVYAYIMKWSRFEIRPCQLAKALNLDEATIMAALKELEKQGKINLRIPNIEWHRRR
jgi:Mn-dependent DtxR family transcriptional regulator